MGQKIYFDTNQIYYIRRISDEADGSEFGDYSWAYRVFPDKPELVADIRALCYIVALQDQWDLEFTSSDASYTELCLSTGNRAVSTRRVWEIVSDNLDKRARRLAWAQPASTQDGLQLRSEPLAFISDVSDRIILRDFMEQGADVLLTSDDHILSHKTELARMGAIVTRPHDWINDFLRNSRGDEDGVDFTERILFTIGGS